VTVTSVSTSPDLRHAKVFVSTIGTEEQRVASLAALKSAASHLRTVIGKGLRIRRVPDLHFELDEAGDRGARIQQLLGSIADGGLPPETLSPLPAPTRTGVEEKSRRSKG
jgi:ribosome-binding factor A